MCLSFKSVAIAFLPHHNVIISVFLEDFRYFTCINSFSFPNYPMCLVLVLMSISHLRKLRHRQARRLTQDHRWAEGELRFEPGTLVEELQSYPLHESTSLMSLNQESANIF